MSDDSFELSRRKALGALASIGVGSAAVGAGTFAAFSDTETSTGNGLTTGELNLEAGNTETLQFQTKDIKPGDSGSSKVSLTNSGNIQGDLGITITAISDDEGDTPESETADVKLSQALDLKLFLEPNDGGSGTAGTYDSSYDTGLKTGGGVTSSGSSYSYSDANEYPTGNQYGLGTLDATHDFVVKWRLPSDGGDVDINGVMDDSITIDLEFALTQTNT